MQHPSIGSVPSVAALSTPAACYSTGGGSDHFTHNVEHGVHSANECTGTAMCQAASGFTPKGVLNHCALSRAHNLLNGMPSNILGRKWPGTYQAVGTWVALRVMVKVEEQDALGLQQLSPKLISTRIITKYGKLHYSTLIRVVESCTMVLIQQNQHSIRSTSTAGHWPFYQELHMIKCQ